MKKKLVSLLLVASMAASMMACGAKQEEVASEEAAPFELTSIKMVVDGTLTATVDNGQADFEKQWEDAVGVDLQIQQLDHSGYSDAVGRLFASGDMPDVMIMSAGMYAQYATTGILWDMTEAFDNAEFQSRIQYPAVNENLKKDGKLYGFAPAYGNGCVTYVKKAWLDAAGVDASSIKTFDDYYNMLLAFKDSDPDGNGKSGTYGCIAAGYISDEAPWTNYLPEFWQDAYPSLLQDENGVWYDGFDTDATKAAIERIAKGVADGVIDPTTLTNDTKSARTSWFSNDQSAAAGCFTYWAGTWYQNLTDELIKAELDSEIVELAPIAEVGAYINREAPVWVIIDDMDGDNTREQAIFDAFVETMLDGGEVQTLWTYGAKGVHWDTCAEEFTLNPGTDKEKVCSYEEGQFHLKQSPLDPNTQWKKNAMDPTLVIAPLAGDYADFLPTSELILEGNKFFVANMKDAPSSPSCDAYTNYAGDIHSARKVAIAAVVNDGVSVDEAMETYRATTKDWVAECLAQLNAN